MVDTPPDVVPLRVDFDFENGLEMRVVMGRD